jgi:hypothetical protein
LPISSFFFVSTEITGWRASARALRFVPQADLANFDPIWTTAIDARTTRHPGYRLSTIKRKRIEEPSGVCSEQRK